LKTHRLIFLLTILLLLVTLTTACKGTPSEQESQQANEQEVAVIVALTQTAMAMEEAPEPVIAATAEPQSENSGWSPLMNDCNDIKAVMEPELQLMISNQEVPVETSWSGEIGTACQLTALANANDFNSIFEPSQTLKTMLSNLGWMETMHSPCLGQGGMGPGADTACFINEKQACELFVTLAPVDQSLCPDDQPIGVCFDALAPEQKIFTISLTCAEGQIGMTLPKALGAIQVSPFDDDMVDSLALTGVPFMFPPGFLIEDSLPSIVPYFNFRDAEIYELSLDYGEGCYGASACHYGVIMGKRADGTMPTGTVNYPYMPAQGQQVSLANGITGYFMEANCGASCGDAVVYWLHEGYEYMVGLKAGRLEDVIALADATILNSIDDEQISSPMDEDALQRIQFAPGSTMAQIPAMISQPVGGHHYVLKADKDQYMTVNLRTTDDAILVIWGTTGANLLDGSASAKAWEGPLPAAQDYYIDVRSMSQEPIDYTLEVAISAWSSE